MSLVVRGGEVDGRPADVLVSDGVVVAVGTGLRPAGEHDTLDAGGGAVLPGLHDHHTHLLAQAAALRSVDVSAAAVGNAAGFHAALRRAAAAAGGGWVRAVGYHPATAGPLDRHRLDALVGRVPARVQHAGGAAWVLSSAALEAVGVESHDGWLHGRDDELVHRWPAEPLDLRAVGRRLADRGVTAVTDATPFTDPAAVALLAEADLPQRVVVTGAVALPGGDGLPRGPVKVVIADHDLPAVDEVADQITAAHAAGRPVAVHCVTAAALALLLAAWEAVGAWPGDRIEHGAVIPPAAIPVLAGLGVTVVTQPAFVADRGDRYLAEVDAVDRPDLWRAASLVAGGVRLAAGSDAPFGPADPWRSVAAATDRRTAGGQVLGAGERLPPAAALDLWLTPLEDPGGPPRRVAPGTRGLCVLDRPLAAALADPAAVEVTASVPERGSGGQVGVTR